MASYLNISIKKYEEKEINKNLFTLPELKAIIALFGISLEEFVVGKKLCVELCVENKNGSQRKTLKALVRETGLEPAHPCEL
jgi:hypothetical protein